MKIIDQKLAIYSASEKIEKIPNVLDVAVNYFVFLFSLKSVETSKGEIFKRQCRKKSSSRKK